ncbi:MAG: hypothetical protein ACREKE_04680 [bacterium]
MQNAGDNIAAEREAVLHFLEDLGSNSGVPIGVLGSAGADRFQAAVRPAFSPMSYASLALRRRRCDLRQAGESPCRIKATRAMMTALSSIAVQAIGSPAQASLAQSLQSYGGTLAESTDPTLSAQGGLMQEESSAVNLGDAASAQSFVSAMQGLPQESTSVPSPADQAWIASLQQTAVSGASSAASSLGQAGMQALLNDLGSNSTGGSGDTSFIGPLLSSLENKGAGTTSLSGGALSGMESQGLGALVGGQSESGGQGIGASLAVPTGASDMPISSGSGSASGGALPSTNL